jgi:hypothetical protein
VLATLLGVGTEHAVGSDQSDLVRAPQQSAQQSTNEPGQRLVEKNLNIQRTLTIRPGGPLRVTVEKDLVLQPLPALYEVIPADRGKLRHAEEDASRTNDSNCASILCLGDLSQMCDAVCCR